MERKNRALTQYKSDLYNNLRKRKYEQNFQEFTSPYVILRPIVRHLYDADQTPTDQTRSRMK